MKDKNPAAEGFDYRTPWHEAAFGGSLKIIKFYYKILPDITINDSNAWNAIHYAAFKGHIKVVRFLADLETGTFEHPKMSESGKGTDEDILGDATNSRGKTGETS